VLAVVVECGGAVPAAFAAQLPSLPKGECVVDDAGVLSSSTAQTITELNAQLESSCSGAQIGVLTVEYTGNDSTEDYAVQAANAWGIGSSTGKNGVLILLVMETQQYADGDYYIATGDGFRNTTLEKQASAIAQTMEDQFAAKDYDGAVTTCARNVANTIGIIACVFYCQYTDLCAAAAGFQLGVQFGDGLHGAAAQHTGIVHHTLALGQALCGAAAQHRRTDHHGQHQCADAFCKVFHAKGSTSFTPDKAPSTLAGKPPTSF